MFNRPFNFGSSNTQQQSNAFGSTSTFGRSNTFAAPGTSTFGATNTASTPFGSTNTQGTSLFGTPSQATGSTGGLFGASTGFGSAAPNTGGSLFGTQNQTTSTGLFGSTTGTTNAFGTQNKPFSFSTPTSSNTGGSLFNTGTAGSSLFGSNTATTNVVGTTVKYQPVVGTDTMTRNGVTNTIQTRIEVISCMKEYDSKSLEELRFEDYAANRKGPGQGTAIGGATTGGFGQTTSTGGLFGSQMNSTASGGLFGKPAENKPLFGGTSTGFGAASSSGGTGLFGSTNAAPAFGQAATGTSTSGFSFGQPAQQNKPAGTGFSSFPSTGMFGQTQPATGGAFGATSTAGGTGGFSFGGQNNQATGGLFGQSKPAFGAATSTGGASLFTSTANKPATGFGGFNSTTPAFGAAGTGTQFGSTNATTGGGLFNTQNKPAFGLGSGTGFGGTTGSTFGTGTTGGGLFGSTNATTGGGLFGNTQNKPAGGLNFNSGTGFSAGTGTLGFGLGTNNKPGGFGTLGTGGFGTGGTFGGGTTLGGAVANNNMGAATAVVDNNIANLIKALTDNPFGHSSLLKTPANTSGKAEDLLSPTSISSSTSTKPPTYVLPTSVHNRPLPLPTGNSPTPSLITNKSLLFAGLDDTLEGNPNVSGEDIFKTKTYPSVKKLNLKVFNKQSDSPQFRDSACSSPAPSQRVTSPLTTIVNTSLDHQTITPDIIKGRDNMRRLNINSLGKKAVFNDTLADLNVLNRQGSNGEVFSSPARTGGSVPTRTDGSVPTSPCHNMTIHDESQAEEEVNPAVDIPPTGIQLSRAGYYTIPSMSELVDLIDENNECYVENFTVGRHGYGNVCFSSQTNVMNLDLDNIVFIVRKEVDVYPDPSTKPSVGEALNKPAVITLDAVWPVDKTTREVISDVERLDNMGWARYLEKKCVSMDARFLEYRPDTGSWVFKVSHFSKYGLQDDDDDDMENVQQLKPTSQEKAVNTQSKTTDTSLVKKSAPPTSSVSHPPPYFSGLGGENTPTTSEAPTPPTYLGGAPPITGLSSPTSPSTSLGASNQVSVRVASTAPQDLFMNSFASGPDEGASMGHLSAGRGFGFSQEKTSALSQLAANMFPEDDDDYSEESRVPNATTYLQEMELTCVPPRAVTPSVTSVKRFAGGRASPIPSEGRLSVAASVTNVLDSRDTTTKQQSISSFYRPPRTKYPSLPVGNTGPSHPSVVAPSSSLSSHLPLHESSMWRQYLQGAKCPLLDAAAFMGSSTRIGWGPNWHLVHGGNQFLSSEIDVVSSCVAPKVTNEEQTPAPYLFLPSTAGSGVVTSNALSADGRCYGVKMERLHLTDLSSSDISLDSPKNNEVTVELCMAEILRHSSLHTDGTAPSLRHSKGTKLLHRLSSKLQQLEDVLERKAPIFSIVELCLALWGKLDTAHLDEANLRDSAYLEARFRVETLSEWLVSVSREQAHREVESREEEEYLEAVFSHLTVREMVEACQTLQQKGDHHLAMLIAQSCMGDNVPRQIMSKQLANWSECGADTTISHVRLMLYCLVAGQLTHAYGDKIVNVCKGLDWRRALALHLWFLSPATCSISEALETYEKGAAMSGSGEKYCEKPLPPYLYSHTVPDSTNKLSYDMCYHLIKLFVDPTYRLDKLLNPVTNTPDPLDVTTSWVILTLLQSLGYTHVEPYVANGLHLSMASHLESCGLWHWAVFVLMYLSDENSRAVEIKAVLCRNVQVVDGIELEDDHFVKLIQERGNVAQSEGDNSVHMEEEDGGFVDGEDDVDNSMDTDQRDTPSQEDYDPEEMLTDFKSYKEREEFLINKLKIPVQWMNECKSILARSLNMVEAEAWYLIKAGDLSRAHDLLVKTIAPAAIINEDHEYLRKFVTAFEASSSSLTVNVPHWKVGGGVYSNYLHILSTVEEIKQTQQPTQTKVETLRPRLLSLCTELNSLSTPTAEHRLCVSEISRVVIGVLRAVLCDDISATTAIATQVSQLPLTRDCALQELNTLMHQYLTGIAK